MTKKNNQLIRAALCTDLHFGKKSNSEVHNQDCLNYLQWFCGQVKKDSVIDHIIFMGDWHENRSALNLATLNHSLSGARMLNDLGLPVFFIIGNHDLYHRHTRALHSMPHFAELTNFIVIEEPTIVKEIGNGGSLISPYLFHDEYTNMKTHLNLETWFGHFEFKGFVVTGYNVKMPTGPDADEFNGPKRIFSGHFHKRQIDRNICYIGSCFPYDFGDSGDSERGMAVYDHTNDNLEFTDWAECPKYIKCTLSSLLDNKVELYENARVKCIVDTSIGFEESTEVRQRYMDEFKLREFTLEETSELADLVAGEIVDIKDEELEDVNALVIQMLTNIETDKINNDKLVHIYKGLVE